MNFLIMNSTIQWLERLSVELPPAMWNTAVIVFAILAGIVLKFLIAQILKFYNARADSFLVKSFSNRLHKISLLFIPLVMLNFSVPFLRLGRLELKMFDKWLEVGLTVCFAGVLIALVRIAEDYVSHRYDYSKANNLRERRILTQLQFIRNVVVLVIIMVTVAIVLLSFENMRKIGAGMLTGVGVGGIIIGFAAQKSLGNLLAGFQIAFTQPIRIDDALVVEGEFGKVEEITLTYVVLNIWDQRRLILPINYFIEKPFQNWTRTSSDLIGAVYLYVDYSLPIEPLRKEVTRLLSLTKLWDGRVNNLAVTDASKETIELRVLVSAQNSGDTFDLRCYIRERLVMFLQQNYPNSLPQHRIVLDKDRIST
jgi:small-conductance mechanosensitive channel